MKERNFLFFSMLLIMISSSGNAVEKLAVQSEGFVNDTPLFSSVSQADRDFINNTALMSSLNKDPGVKVFGVVKINETMIERSVNGFRLNMGSNSDFFVYQNDSYTFGRDSVAWLGNIGVSNDDATSNSSLVSALNSENHVVLIKTGNHIQGEIYLDGQVYELRATQDGRASVLLQVI